MDGAGGYAMMKVSVLAAHPALTSHAVILTNSDLLRIQIWWFVDRELEEPTNSLVLPRRRFQIS
jgi:hypothetical protein